MMKNFSKIAILLSLTVIFTTQAVAAKKVRWSLAMTWPKNLKPLSTTPQKLSKLLEQMSGGNFIIKVDDAGKHKAPLGIFNYVKSGQYEMGHSASYYWKGIDTKTALITTTPFGMTMAEQQAWLFYGDGMKYMEKIYAPHGILSFPGGSTGVQMGGWFAKEIKNLDDLQGLKMRIPGIAGEVFAKLGVNVTNIAPGELYTSLDRGTIDALEWVGPAMDIKMGFHKIAPYYYTGWHEPASDMQFMINKKAYDKLPKEYQTMLLTAIKAVSAEMFYEHYHMSADAWEQMKQQYPNIKVKTFPKEVLQAMKKATDEVMAQYGKDDPLFKEIYENQQSYMKKVREWTKISEYDYIKTSEVVH